MSFDETIHSVALVAVLIDRRAARKGLKRTVRRQAMPNCAVEMAGEIEALQGFDFFAARDWPRWHCRRVCLQMRIWGTHRLGVVSVSLLE